MFTPEREGKQQQEAYLYAGNHLGFTSGQDTNIAGTLTTR
ncbi:adhesin [Pseudomonas syringae pv. actinidiae ICMP 18804]|nr:adhesin [Pseudomonas syringae pv. actinidiae ICMP 18804]